MGGANDAHSHRIGRHAEEAERDRACARAARRTRPFFFRVAFVESASSFASQVGAWRGLETIELIKLKLKIESRPLMPSWRAQRCCDGVAAATELRRPAPSRSFYASRLDATR